jgi:hypothetical protein
MKTEDLISALAQDLKPVVPARTAFQILFRWVLLCLVIITLTLSFLNLRPDFLQSLKALDVLLQLLIFGGVMVAALWIAAVISRPGAQLQSVHVKSVVGLLVFSALLQVLRVWGMSPGLVSEGLNIFGGRCALVALATGFMVGGVLTWQSCLLAPLKPGLTGAFIGLAALGAGGLSITLHCGNDNGLHILLWHLMLPMVTLGLTGLAAGKYFLRW